MNVFVGAITKWLRFRFATEAPRILLVLNQLHLERFLVVYGSVVLLQVGGLHVLQLYKTIIIVRKTEIANAKATQQCRSSTYVCHVILILARRLSPCSHGDSRRRVD